MATKKATTKVTEVKEVKEVKEETAKKATPAKKATTKKATASKTVKSPTVITVQFQGNEVSTAVVEEKVKAQFVAEGHKASTIKTLNIYVKPEEFAAYYVINDKFAGRVDLF